MVNHSPALDATFAALADPTRRAILARLTRGEASVTDLARPCGMSLPAVLKHLAALEDGGLLASRKEGRVRICRLEAAPLAAASSWIERHRRLWEERLDALDRYLKDTLGKENEPWQPASRSPRPSSRSRAASRRRARRSSRPSSTRRR